MRQCLGPFRDFHEGCSCLCSLMTPQSWMLAPWTGMVLGSSDKYGVKNNQIRKPGCAHGTPTAASLSALVNSNFCDW